MWAIIFSTLRRRLLLEARELLTYTSTRLLSFSLQLLRREVTYEISTLVFLAPLFGASSGRLLGLECGLWR